LSLAGLRFSLRFWPLLLFCLVCWYSSNLLSSNHLSIVPRKAKSNNRHRPIQNNGQLRPQMGKKRFPSDHRRHNHTIVPHEGSGTIDGRGGREPENNGQKGVSQRHAKVNLVVDYSPSHLLTFSPACSLSRVPQMERSVVGNNKIKSQTG
jgi:hypothetical protein